MRNIFIALGILLVPVIGYLVLQTGKNHYVRLPYFGPKRTVGVVRVTKGRKIADTIFHTIKPFELTDPLGHDFSSSRLKGHIYVCNFFYTSCPDVCKLVHSGMDSLIRIFGIHPDIKYLSITVDPAHDTPAILKTYAARYKADPRRWYFLTGNRDTINALARKAFLVDSGPATHSQLLTLVDGHGHIRGYFDGTQEKEFKRLTDELIVLRLEQMREQLN